MKKYDVFIFNITKYPFLSNNIPSLPAYDTFISQLIRYDRAWSSCGFFFISRATRLSKKILEQGYVKIRLKSSLKKFYGRYGDLIKQYEVPPSRMFNDNLKLSHIQWHPQTFHRTLKLLLTWPFTELREVSMEQVEWSRWQKWENERRITNRCTS